MSDIPFQIGGNEVPCPDFAKSDFTELGDIAYQYMDGSPLYLGMPSVTYFWPNLLPAHVTAIRGLYNTLVTTVDLISTHGTPVSLTVPDYLNGGLRTTTAYMLEPTGTAKGDGTTDFKVTFTNLHEGALITALATAAGNMFDTASNGGNIEIGSTQYSGLGWQF